MELPLAEPAAVPEPVAAEAALEPVWEAEAVPLWEPESVPVAVGDPLLPSLLPDDPLPEPSSVVVWPAAPGSDVITLGCEVMTLGCEVMTEGMPVIMPSELVSVM